MRTCPFAKKGPLSKKFHDTEWCVPKTNERQLFEILTMETFQAGLSWQGVLRKRAAMDHAFKNFNWLKLGHMSSHYLHYLFNDKQIIRNHMKIEAVVHNARVLIRMHKHHRSLAKLTWRPVDYRPTTHRKHHNYALPTHHFVRLYLPKFKKVGFKFVGPKILYSYLQDAGVVNDHVIYCYRYPQIIKLDKAFRYKHHH